LSNDGLWKRHEQTLQYYSYFEAEFDRGEIKQREVSNSFLDLKAEIGKKIMSNCNFCERGCRVDRLGGMQGYCGCGGEFAVSSCFPHMGEEPELVPSGTVFTSGCSIRCIHCQNYDISQWYDKGTSITPDRMSLLVGRLVDEGCKNINMVGGDPTPNAYLWIDTFRKIDKNVATIWNSNSYYSKELHFSSQDHRYLFSTSSMEITVTLSYPMLRVLKQVRGTI
jgi:putative pyruvate formate lyase activating enzyme